MLEPPAEQDARQTTPPITAPGGWKQRVIWLAATCCGLGLSPVAPGTVTALLGVAIYVAIALLAPLAWQGWLIGLALLIFCALTIALGDWAERYWQKKDSGAFVTDEVAGYLFTVLLFRTPDVLLTVLWTFPFTRVIDIVKVPPARRLESIPKGWGVLADDLMASVYAAALLHGLALVIPSAFGLK